MPTPRTDLPPWKHLSEGGVTKSCKQICTARSICAPKYAGKHMMVYCHKQRLFNIF